MKPSTYLNKRIKTARDRARIKDYLLDMYLSEAEVERAILTTKQTNTNKNKKDG